MYTGNLTKIPNIKVHKHLSDGSYSKTCSGTDGQTDRQTDRPTKLSKESPSHVVTRKSLHMGKTCSCLRNNVIASDKKDCYFGTYWPSDFQAVSFQCLLQQY